MPISIMKAPVNLLCSFVPRRRWRKKIRQMLTVSEKTKRRRRELLDYGCKIENGVITTPQGVKIDTLGALRESLGNLTGVFVNKRYALDFSADAVLIDIGMNLGIVSLFFAAYPNVRKIYSYEPFKHTFELAGKNFRMNPRLGEKIKAFNFGLGKTDGTLELPYIDDRTGKMSTTYDVCKDQENVRKETVAIRDAAQEFAGILDENKKKLIIVKCNCEGAEFEIFERLNEANLVAGIDVVLMDYHFKKPDGLVGMLTKNGFVVRTKVASKDENKGTIFAVRMARK